MKYLWAFLIATISHEIMAQNAQLAPLEDKMKIGFEVDSFGNDKGWVQRYWVEGKMGYLVREYSRIYKVNHEYNFDSVLKLGDSPDDLIVRVCKSGRQGLLQIYDDSSHLILPVVFDSTTEFYSLSYENSRRYGIFNLVAVWDRDKKGFYHLDERNWIIPLTDSRKANSALWKRVNEMNRVHAMETERKKEKQDSLHKEFLRKQKQFNHSLYPMITYDTFSVGIGFVSRTEQATKRGRQKITLLSLAGKQLSQGDSCYHLKYDSWRNMFALRYSNGILAINTQGTRVNENLVKARLFDRYHRYWRYQVIREKGKYGLYDWKEMKVALKPVFDHYMGVKGRHFFRKNGYYRMFDLESNQLLQDSFAYIIGSACGNGIIGVKKQGFYIINRRKERKNEFSRYHYQGCMGDKMLLRKKKRYYLLDVPSRRRVRLKYDSASFVGADDYENLPSILINVYKDGKMGLIDKTGKSLLPIEFNGYHLVHFDQRLAPIDSHYLYIYTRENHKKNVLVSSYSNRVIAKNISDYMRYTGRNSSYSLKWFTFRSYDKYGAIMIPDSLVLRPIFDSCLSSNLFRLKNMYFHLNFDSLPFQKSQLYDTFYYTKGGQLVLSNGEGESGLLVFQHYSGGPMKVYHNSSGFDFIREGKYYTFNEKGKIGLVLYGSKIEAEFDEIRPCLDSEKAVWVRKKDKWGLLQL